MLRRVMVNTQESNVGSWALIGKTVPGDRDIFPRDLLPG